MSNNIQLILLLHNHQPIGNFDGVFEQAYRDSYLPFLEVFERYETLKIALHTSGPLMEWLDRHHPEYVDRLAALVSSNRIEIIGGAFYEPILSMIPSRDRVGQITDYTNWLEKRLGAQIHGMWIAERVWEQSLVSDLSRAKIDYTLLDDHHFKKAGLRNHQLMGYHITEDDGHTVGIFPGSEQLRYLIPFAEPQETVDYLRSLANQYDDPIVVFGDDGEKFGTWPETKKHVYEDGWLHRFFDVLVDNQSWIHVSTPAETFHNNLPLGKIYLPEGSYREMTEWALPTDRQLEYDQLVRDMHDDDNWPRITPFIRGGFWRNFKVKYSEADEMYSRMMWISRRLADAMEHYELNDLVEVARRELYRAQCNCSYWHGAFGGIYLPHLRNAVFQHLIAADNLLDRITGKSGAWVEANTQDYNFDGRQEICLANDQLITFLEPSRGGQWYEFDVRSICHNLLATLRRRPEAYHEKVKQGASKTVSDRASIHDRVVFKQDGLEDLLHYDSASRKSLLDRFFDHDVTLDALVRGQAVDRGNFVNQPYDARLRKNPDRIQVQLTRTGTAFGRPIQITKGLTLQAGSSHVEIAYLLEGVPHDQPLHFGVELNFSGLPSGADDRFFYQGDQQRLGQLDTRLELENTHELGLIDQWLGINLKLSTTTPTQFWTYPVETVSQSEAGFELVHQSVVVMPHWMIRGDQEGRWSVTMILDVTTFGSENYTENVVETVVS